MCIESSPDLRDSLIDRQYSLAERPENLFKPVFNSRGLSSVSRPQSLNPLPYLSDHQNAKEKFVVAGGSIPGGYVRIAPPSLPDFRYDVRVDQVHSMSMTRAVLRDRRILMPSSGADASNALKLLPPVRKR